jgi:hypothetical protein
VGFDAELFAHRAERASLEFPLAVLNRRAVIAKEDRRVAAVALGCELKMEILAASQFSDSPQELFARHELTVAHIGIFVNTKVYEPSARAAYGFVRPGVAIPTGVPSAAQQHCDPNLLAIIPPC